MSKTRTARTALAVVLGLAVVGIVQTANRDGEHHSEPTAAASTATVIAPTTGWAAPPTTTNFPTAQDYATPDDHFVALFHTRAATPPEVDDATAIAYGRRVCVDVAAGASIPAAGYRSIQDGVDTEDADAIMEAAVHSLCTPTGTTPPS